MKKFIKQFTGEKMKNKKRNKSLSIATSLNNTQGMTIVEIMIVLTIIASIAGMTGYFVMGALVRANVKQAKIEMNTLEGAVNGYYLNASPHKFPDSLQQLTEGAGAQIEKVKPDPWGNDYVFKKISHKKFEIYSLGPDGQDGTEDDVKTEE